MHSHGLHHIHKRKKDSKLKSFPHKNPWIRFLDTFLLVVAIIAPVMTIPQLLEIYLKKNVAGVSVLSWALFALFNIPWLVYGFVHKEKPILVSSSLWFITNLAVAIGAFVY